MQIKTINMCIDGGVTTFSQVKEKFFGYIPGKFEKKIKKTSGMDIVFTNLNTCNSCNKKLNISSYVYYVYGALERKSIFCSKECMHKTIENSEQ